MTEDKHLHEEATLTERFRGTLVGLATGDALGTTLEFRQPGSFSPIGDMVGGGPFSLEAGQWTDDTSMAMCLAESLLARDGFDPRDQMDRYIRWQRHGYWSSTGTCFDIGNTVRAALDRYEQTGDPFSGSTHPHSAGNGSLMRLAPVPLFYAFDPPKAIRRAGDSSRTTHAAASAVDACRFAAAFIIGALQGLDAGALLAPEFWSQMSAGATETLAPEIAEIANGSYKTRQPPQIKGTGYVVRSLEAALWAFYRSRSFKEGCLLAANLGDDADTTAAIFGQFAGAYYGERGIPRTWRQKLTRYTEIVKIADALLRAA
jgi:ADP-ribosylglycohydrolase